MRKVLALALLLLLAGVVADSPPEDVWVVSAFQFGAGTYEVTPSLEIQSDNSLSLKLDSTEESRAVFKLWHVFDHPDADNFEMNFEARVNAPGVDLDRDKEFSSGEGIDSDGPNLFAFAYAYPDAASDNFGSTKDSVTFLPNKANSTLCHVHFECNWVGDPEQYYGFYCSSETTFQGWLADGAGIGQYGTNQFTEEPFEVNEWKTVRLSFNAGECNTDVISIMVMGVDPLSDTPYTWEFRNFKVVGSTTQQVKFDDLYLYASNDYTQISPPPYCGDLVKNADEECDGSDGESEGLYCQTDCTLKPQCGDNYIAGDEVCDGLKVTKGFSCSADCSEELSICGDGVLVADEVCDPGAPPMTPAIVTEGFRCSGDCKSEIAVCGDDIVVGIEECDGEAGIITGYQCADDCTLYRLLREEENAVMNKIIPLALEADFGQPSISEIEFENNGTLDLEDLMDQVKLRNVTGLQNANFSFCTAEFADCEEKYMFSEEFVVNASSMHFTKPASGLMKVYKVLDGNDTRYLVGVKHEKSILDFLSDPNFWMGAGVLIAVLVIGGIVLVLALVGLYVYAKQRGMSISRAFQTLFMRKRL